MPTDNAPLVLSDNAFSTPTVLELPSGVPVVQITHRGVTMDDLMALFDAGFSVLAGLGPIGPGYALYDGDPHARFDLTIGFPVASVPANLPEGVSAATFPEGRALVLSHLGAFDGLPAGWEKITQHPEAAGRSTAIEIYVTDPSQFAAEDLRTDLVVPLG